MDDREMGRNDFFKYIFRKSVSIAKDLAGGILEPLHRVEEAAQKAFTHPLIPLEEYCNGPKLITSSSPPVYLVGEFDKNLTAFSALCEKDGFLLAYLPGEDALYCSLCNRKHTFIRCEDSVKADLPVIPLTVKEGYIYLLK